MLLTKSLNPQCQCKKSVKVNDEIAIIMLLRMIKTKQYLNANVCFPCKKKKIKKLD